MSLPLTAMALLAALTPAAAPPVDFALRDGDTVIFLGDSITAARTYGKYIENYTLLRFPDRRVRFVNAGRGGDTASGGLKRLEQDVFAHKPTVLTVAYGVNDIGWGLRADARHRQMYLDGIVGIVDACKRRGVRVYVCSAAITAADPDKSEHDFLQRMCDEGLRLARERGAGAIDVQRPMRAALRRVRAWNARFKGQESLHAADGVHLNDAGQLAMAFAILKGLNAPAEVSTVRLDARDVRLVEARGCRVSGVARRGDELSFTRLDAGLPFNYGIFFPLHYRFVSVPEELNRYMLTVEHLAPARWEVRADGRRVGAFTERQLAGGVNLASATADAWEPGGPWDAQADVLRALTESRHQLALAALHARAWLPGTPVSRGADEDGARVNREIERMQRDAARPRPYRIVLRPALAEKSP